MTCTSDVACLLVVCNSSNANAEHVLKQHLFLAGIFESTCLVGTSVQQRSRMGWWFQKPSLLVVRGRAAGAAARPGSSRGRVLRSGERELQSGAASSRNKELLHHRPACFQANSCILAGQQNSCRRIAGCTVLAGMLQGGSKRWWCVEQVHAGMCRQRRWWCVEQKFLQMEFVLHQVSSIIEMNHRRPSALADAEVVCIKFVQVDH